jgi:hypothetical protein
MFPTYHKVQSATGTSTPQRISIMPVVGEAGGAALTPQPLHHLPVTPVRPS